MQPLLVATDLDGTLLRSDGSISGASLTLLRGMVEAGVVLAMVTGRPPRWLDPVLSQTGVLGPVICANGALVLDETGQRVAASHPIPAESLAEVIRRLAGVLPGVVFAVETEHGLVRETDYEVRYDVRPGEVRPVPREELPAQQAVKLLVRSDSMQADDLLGITEESVSDLVTCTHSSLRSLAEISALGVTKATGLSDVAERFGIAADRTVAFGDMPNDIPMLQWAGTGVAVADAHPLALAAADTTTASNDDDGVAQYLSTWFG